MTHNKIAILNDSHFDYRNGSTYFIEYHRRFLKQFFDYCDQHHIQTIIHLGDLFDNRKHITTKGLRFVQNDFLKVIQEKNMHMHIIPGNHDTSHRNTIDLCSVEEVLQHYSKNITLYMKPTAINPDGNLDIALVPWIAPENHDECVAFIASVPASIIMGHFDIAGFDYIANSHAKSVGFSRDLFSKYEHVYSGHYHTKSTRDNITYLGAQYQFNWGDIDDKRYFHVLDTKTREITPVENKDRIFVKLVYDDKNNTPTVPDKGSITGKYVRVIVANKLNYYAFDQYIEQIKSHNPYDLSINESYVVSDDSNHEDATIEDTLVLIQNYIDNNLETNLDKNKIKQMLIELHNEAVNNADL